MSARVAVLVMIAFVACQAPVETATGTATPDRTVSAPPPNSTAASAVATQLPGASVQVSVNDGPPTSAGHGLAASGEGPTVVTLLFPFAMDHPSVEQWVPLVATRTWTDDRTLRLTFPQTEEQIAFKVPESRTAIGGATVGLFTIDLRFPEARTVRIYAIADLTVGTRVPTPSVLTRVRRGDGLTVSSDGKLAIVYDGFGPGAGPPPTLFDMETKASVTLVQPQASDGWFSFADWMSDGRLVMVGRSVWIGARRGDAMRRLADAQAAVGGYPWVAVPAPRGDRLALWGYNTDGHVAIVDLNDGTVSRLTGPFRRSGADGAVQLAWSVDGSMLAGTDSDAETGPERARVRVVDVATDRTLRTLEGNVFSVRGLANGELIIARDSGERGAGQRLLGLRAGFDLIEKTRYLGCGWTMSRDHRYLLQTECGGAGFAGFTLIDLRSGVTYGVGLPAPGSPRWLADGRLAYY